MENEKKTENNLISKVAVLVMSGMCFLFPLIFNPKGLGMAIDFPKWTLLFVVMMIMMILTGLQMFLSKKVIVASKSALFLVGGMGVVALVSAIVGTGEVRAFLYGRTGLFIVLAVIFLTSMNLLKGKMTKILNSLIASSLVLSAWQFLAFLEILPKIAKAEIFANKGFTPVGNQLFLATLLVVTGILTLIKAFYSEDMGKKVLMFVLTGLQVVALVFAVAQILPGQAMAPKFLKFSYGWPIAVDQLKQAKTGLLGVGTDNFMMAFRQSRNPEMNTGADWALAFNLSSNEWLMVLTTMGVIGIALFALIILSLLKSGLKLEAEKRGVFWGFLILVLLISLMPGNYISYFLLLILGLIIVKETKKENDVETEVIVENPAYSVPFYVMILLVFILIPVMLILPVKWLGKISLVNMVRAEGSYVKSLQYYRENKGVEAYNAQIKAMELNPFNLNYRLSYANTCIALANAIASNENLTDEDKSNISQLVSQSIREAKAAIALSPDNASLWANLAQLYRGLISYAQGADQWALSAYVQAIRLDNTNPQLRLDLGGLLYALGAYEDAIDQFKQAISLKRDFPNAYYNLSYAYRQNNQIVQSYNAMQNVVALIDINSADYERALNELKELQKLLPEDEKQATGAANLERESQLTKPEVASPAANQIELNQEELAPEVNESGFEDILQENKEATNGGEMEQPVE